MEDDVKHWRSATVLELQDEKLLFVVDGNHGEYRPRSDEFTENGVAFIRAADMEGGQVLFKSASKINATARKRVTKGIGAPGDILLSHKGTVGKLALVPPDAPAFVCSPQTTLWRTLDNDRLDRGYLYAFMRSAFFKRQLDACSGETDMAAYASLTSQRSFRVLIPPPPEQRAIAQVLGTLDDKIELNRKMNETLEEMARALFKSWFVDFDPVHAKAAGKKPYGMDDATAALFPDSFEESALGLIPRGWRVGTLLDCADLVSGGTPHTSVAEYWDGSIGWASAKDVSNANAPFILNTERCITELGLAKSSTKIVPPMATVLVARGATTGRHVMFARPLAMNQTCYALVSKIEAPFALFCLFGCQVERLLASAHGSVFDTITTKTLQSLKVLHPERTTQASFNSAAAPLFNLIARNMEATASLAQIRDTLLPKLLSGELRIKDAERMVSEVA